MPDGVSFASRDLNFHETVSVAINEMHRSADAEPCVSAGHGARSPQQEVV